MIRNDGELRTPGAVLIVDDEARPRRCMERFLGRLGHHVDAAESVPEALERMTFRSYDLVVTDLRMPQSSGLDLLAQVRSRWPGTRTILMSGAADVTDAASAIQHGVDQLFIKPFGWEPFKAGVEKALAQKQALEHAAAERASLEAELCRREIENGS